MERWQALALLAVVLGASALHASTVEEITTCMRANIPETVRIQTFQLQSFDRAGESRLLSGRLTASRETDLVRANLRLATPPDLKDAAYLMRESRDGSDEMYIFLPALNKIRRVVGGTRDNPLFGTDFSYNDLRQLHKAFAGQPTQVEAPEMIEGRPVHVLEIRPRAEDQSRYSRVRAWVDVEACTPLRMEFYEGERLSKRLLSPPASLARVDGYWYAAITEMHDLQAGTHTRMSVSEIETGPRLPERLFNPRLFHMGN